MDGVQVQEALSTNAFAPLRARHARGLAGNTREQNVQGIYFGLLKNLMDYNLVQYKCYMNDHTHNER
jgi:hypothetical protein